MKKLALIAVLVSGLSAASIQKTNAQIALGLRAGLPTGISLKTTPLSSRSFEFIVGSYGRGNVNFTALYEFQKQIAGVEGLMFYAGPGLHLNYQDDIYYYRYYYRNGRERYEVRYGRGNYLSGGADAIFGLEYKISDMPMSVGVDIKPTIDIGRYDAFFFMDAALNIRFHL